VAHATSVLKTLRVEEEKRKDRELVAKLNGMSRIMES